MIWDWEALYSSYTSIVFAKIQQFDLHFCSRYAAKLEAADYDFYHRSESLYGRIFHESSGPVRCTLVHQSQNLLVLHVLGWQLQSYLGVSHALVVND